MVALGLGIIYLLPRVTKAIPSPLVAIVALTILTLSLKIDVPTVGDMGELPTTLPVFHLPQVPLTLETLQIIYFPNRAHDVSGGIAGIVFDRFCD